MTTKQQAAIEKVVESRGKKSIGQAMIEAGYTPASAKNPKNLTDSKGFKAAMEKAGITEERLSQVMNEGLEATKTVSVVSGKDADEKTMDFVDVPDYAVRHKYLETALKAGRHVSSDDTPGGNTYHTYIQQNNINPNAPEAKQLVDNTLDMLMEQTSRKHEESEDT